MTNQVRQCVQNDTDLPPPPPPPPAADDNVEKTNNLTISTKLSTDQLICKSPQESGSVKSSIPSSNVGKTKKKFDVILLLAGAQLFFGILMFGFGVMVLLHNASLAQIGGGIWGGCLTIATGISGIMATAQKLCPLKSSAQKLVHTVFLALSLISFAIAQLVVLLAATGLVRDTNNVQIEESTDIELTTKQPSGRISIILPSNYPSLLFNIALLIVSCFECICAATSSYISARRLCPCFKHKNDQYKENLNVNTSHALVSSWLNGKQQSPPPGAVYVVAQPPAASSLGRSKISSNMTPIYAIPSPLMQPQYLGYPLIPAPLGPVPSPIIPPPSRREMMYKIHKKYKSKSRETTPQRAPSRSRSKSKEKQITEQDVVRTYTGLDRTIAEEFIDICDSKNTSLCSCSNSSSNSSDPSCDGAVCNTNSDAASQDYLVNKI